jgi:gluconolactonase
MQLDFHHGLLNTPRRTEAAVTRRRLEVLATAIVLIGVMVPGLATAQQPEIATTVAFTEGPAVDSEGNVYFTEMVFQRIMKLTPSGVLSTFRERSNNANGLLIDPQGRLVACEGADSQRTGVPMKFKPQITRTDLRTGRMEVLVDGYQGKPFSGPNDVTIDGKGRLYFTDLTGGAVYRIDGPGQLARILAAPDIQRPNGIQISPDDKQLYLIEANGAEGASRLLKYAACRL